MEEETTAVEEPRGQMVDMTQLSDQLLGEIQTLRTESDESLREVRNQIANIVTTAPAVEPPMTLSAALAESDEDGRGQAVREPCARRRGRRRAGNCARV